MGSVIDYIECPNCKTEAYNEFYYKTGEEYVNCNNCGYHYSATIKNRDKKIVDLTEDDWEINELKKPYGSYRVKMYKSSGYACGSLENKKQFIAFKANYEKTPEIELVSVSRFLRGKIKVEIIIDNGPEVDGAGFTIEDRKIN